MDRLIDELRKQHEEILQTLKKASLMVLAERDLRTRETEQIRADLNTLYDVLEPEPAGPASAFERFGPLTG